MHETDHNHSKMNSKRTTAQVSGWFLGNIQMDKDQNSTAKALKIDTESQKWAWIPWNLNSLPYKIEDLNRNKILLIPKMSRIQCKITHHINQENLNLNNRHTEDPNRNFRSKNTITKIEKTHWLGSVAEYRRQRKESVNLQIDHKELSYLNNRIETE